MSQPNIIFHSYQVRLNGRQASGLNNISTAEWVWVFFWSGGLMRGIRIPQQDFALKTMGGEGVFAGHYGNKIYRVNFLLFWSLVCLIPRTWHVFYWPILPFLHALDLCQSWKASLLLSMIWVFTFIYNRYTLTAFSIFTFRLRSLWYMEVEGWWNFI